MNNDDKPNLLPIARDLAELGFRLCATRGTAAYLRAYDLEVEVPRLVYEILEIGRDRHWQLSMHRGAIQVLPASWTSDEERR